MSARTHLLPAVMLALGLAIIVRTLAEDTGTAGLLIGVLLALAGGLRLWAETRPR